MSTRVISFLFTDKGERSRRSEEREGTRAQISMRVAYLLTWMFTYGARSNRGLEIQGGSPDDDVSSKQ